MNTAIRQIVSYTYKPLLEKYLSRKRFYRYKNIRLHIAPEVFHPGFFFSTRLLLLHVCKFPLQGVKFLELGCGSGLISIIAAKNGATVTATDINPVAIQFLEENILANNVSVETIQSDLFENLPGRKFDFIAINPPYYKQDPVTYKDHAWYCGKEGEYFNRLFAGLDEHIQINTVILMVLFEGCDMKMIKSFAENNGFIMHCTDIQKNFLEKNYMFRIERKR